MGGATSSQYERTQCRRDMGGNLWAMPANADEIGTAHCMITRPPPICSSSRNRRGRAGTHWAAGFAVAFLAHFVVKLALAAPTRFL